MNVKGKCMDHDKRLVWTVEEVAERLRAPIRVIPGAGHYPWIDQPEAFGETFREVLEGLLAPWRV